MGRILDISCGMNTCNEFEWASFSADCAVLCNIVSRDEEREINEEITTPECCAAASLLFLHLRYRFHPHLLFLSLFIATLLVHEGALPKVQAPAPGYGHELSSEPATSRNQQVDIIKRLGDTLNCELCCHGITGWCSFNFSVSTSLEPPMCCPATFVAPVQLILKREDGV